MIAAYSLTTPLLMVEQSSRDNGVEMTFTYDLSKLGEDDISTMRLALGDTDENDSFLSDEEIIYLITQASTFNLQVAKCCRAIVAKVSHQVKYKAGDFSEDPTGLIKKYEDMALKYERLASGSYPWTSAISIEAKEEVVEDTDREVPKFTKGMHDNP